MCLTSEWFDEAKQRREQLMRDMLSLNSADIRRLIEDEYEGIAMSTVWPIYVEALAVANQVLDGRGDVQIPDVLQRGVPVAHPPRRPRPSPDTGWEPLN